jgi:hypothetical protein
MSISMAPRNVVGADVVITIVSFFPMTPPLPHTSGSSPPTIKRGHLNMSTRYLMHMVLDVFFGKSVS